MSVAINTELKLFVCLACKSSYPSKAMYKHLNKIHKVQKKTINEDSKRTIDSLCIQYDVAENEYPDYAADRVYTAFEGLAVTEYAACPECYSTAGEKWMKQHMAAEHPGVQIPTKFAPCLGQILNKGAAPTILRVVEPQAPRTPSPDAELLDVFASFHQSQALATLVTAPDGRFISPFLSRTKWHAHIQGYDAEELCRLVSMPKDEYEDVVAAIRSYFAAANDLLDGDNTPELVRQKLRVRVRVRVRVVGVLNHYPKAERSDV
jgi:hypothetical protein